MRSSAIQLDVTVDLQKNSRDSLVSYRNTGFSDVQITAKEICVEMNVEAELKQKRFLPPPLLLRWLLLKWSFSKLKQIKTYLRSSMIPARVNGPAIIPISHVVSNQLPYDDLIDKFPARK